MTKIIFIIAGLLFAGTTASAAYGPAGCGLGANLMEGKSGLMYNVFAATTNGTSGNQTFGMTSGTLGCDGEASVANSVTFIENNKFALSNDVSKGEGATLDAYLALINAPSANKLVLKANFAKIFAPENSAEQIQVMITELI